MTRQNALVLLERVRAIYWPDVLMTVVGVLLTVAGASALLGVMSAVQGEAPLLLIGGLALILFGVMVMSRRNMRAARIGLIGLTAGYFATALTEFEVFTDPCDIGATLERCMTDVVRGAPWNIYVGPLFLAVLIFGVIALEPYTRRSDELGQITRPKQG
jgi:hypothetical protein